MNISKLPLLSKGIDNKSVKNGIYNIRSNTPMSGFYVMYKGGASVEQKGNRGISHLMEHLMCKSFDKHADALLQNGIMSNAFTSNDRVAFFIKGMDRYVNEFKHELVESMFEFNIGELEFQLEKQIVLEEYDMSFDSRTDIHFFNTYRKHFDFYCAIGDRDDIKNFTLEQLYEFHKKHFSKPHQIINVSENFPYNESIDMAEDHVFKKIGFRNNNESAIYENSNYDGDTASIIFMSPMVDEKDMPAVDMVTNMLNGGLFSPLMEELRGKRGLVYYVGCGLISQNDSNGNIIISCQSNEKNIEEIEKVTEGVMNDKDRFINDKRFTMTKNNLTITKEKNQIFNFGAIDDLIYESIHINNFIDDITLEDCKMVYEKYFKFENWKKSVDKDDFDTSVNENKKVTKSGIIKLFENKTLKI
jgi:predicted Zn-dependent peptidase